MQKKQKRPKRRRVSKNIQQVEEKKSIPASDRMRKVGRKNPQFASEKSTPTGENNTSNESLVRKTQNDQTPLRDVLSRLVVEVRSGATVSVVSIDEILREAFQEAAYLALTEIKGDGESVVTSFDHAPDIEITARNIKEILLEKLGATLWRIHYYYMENDTELSATTDVVSESGSAGLEKVKRTAADTLGELIFMDGRVNPEFSVQQSTFLCGKSMMLVPQEHLEYLDSTEGKVYLSKTPIKEIDKWFKSLERSFGGEINPEAIASMRYENQREFQFVAALAVKHGKHWWPFHKFK